MKIPLKAFENPVNLPRINSQDFHGFLVHSGANVCNFRESVDSREFLNIFIFCPNNLYSTLISKITLKLVTAFYFFLNRAKFEKR